GEDLARGDRDIADLEPARAETAADADREDARRTTESDGLREPRGAGRFSDSGLEELDAGEAGDRAVDELSKRSQLEVDGRDDEDGIVLLGSVPRHRHHLLGRKRPSGPFRS